MVPEKFRASALPRFCQDKIVVVRNTPVDPGFSPNINFKFEKINVVFAGWLDEGRGIETLLNLAEMDPKFQIHVAGEGSKKVLDKILKLDNCHYYGFLNHKQVLDLTKNCDFVFAHYSPHRKINIFAAPNKLAESLAVGRPVIINSEALVSKNVSHYSCGLVTPYNDTKQLHNKILELCENHEEYESVCANARRLFEREYSWESVKESTINVFKKVEF
jgi:glycosyltransferase involved in cell wall biosynthesis